MVHPAEIDKHKIFPRSCSLEHAQEFGSGDRRRVQSSRWWVLGMPRCLTCHGVELWRGLVVPKRIRFRWLECSGGCGTIQDRSAAKTLEDLKNI